MEEESVSVGLVPDVCNTDVSDRIVSSTKSFMSTKGTKSSGDSPFQKRDTSLLISNGIASEGDLKFLKVLK